MKRVLALSLFILSASLGYSQSCGLISDEAGKVTNSSAIQNGAAALGGADVHVITVPSVAKYGGSLDDVFIAYQHMCPSWQQRNGDKNKNLFVILFSFAPRIQGRVFSGSDFNKLFDGSDAYSNASEADILKRAAGPYIRTDVGMGVGQALAQYGHIKATYRPLRVQQPPQPRTMSQAPPSPPTDYKPIVTFFKWVLFFAVFGIVGYFVYRFFANRQAAQLSAKASKQKAQAAMQDATHKYHDLSSDNPRYGSLSSDYLTLSNSVSFDPNSNGLSADEYDTIAVAWDKLARKIDSAAAYPTGAPEPPQQPQSTRTAPYTPAQPVKPVQPSQPSSPSRGSHGSHRTTIHETTVINNGNDGFFIRVGSGGNYCGCQSASGV